MSAKEDQSVILWNPVNCLIVVDTMTDGDNYPFLVIQQTSSESEPLYVIIPSQEPLSKSDIRKMGASFGAFMKGFDLWDEPIRTVDVTIFDNDGIGESAVLASYLKKNGMEELLKNCSGKKTREVVLIDMSAEGQAND
jgi:hypothetical protein